MLNSVRLFAPIALAASFTLTACAQHGGALLPAPSQANATPDRTPPGCKGQKTKIHYATATDQLASHGGSLCIPAFAGFGGNLKYPSAHPPIALTLNSSTTNYNHQPKLGDGAPLFYLEFSTSAGTAFGNKLTSGGGLTGSRVIAGQPYTAYGQASIFGHKISLGPCYTVATQGKYGGVIGKIGALIKGQNIPFAVTGVIEIYSGKQTNSTC